MELKKSLRFVDIILTISPKLRPDDIAATEIPAFEDNGTHQSQFT